VLASFNWVPILWDLYFNKNYKFLRPMIADLNCPGEVITLIDPNADVIKDPAVQKIFKSLDGERTVVSGELDNGLFLERLLVVLIFVVLNQF
jgi:hypothetical protein